MCRNGLLLFLLLLYVPANAIGDGVPLLINYQGTIEGTENQVSLTFSIHETQSSDSASLWEESHDLEAQNGRFSILLGGLTPLTPGLFDRESLYLATTIGGVELSPRQRIVSTAYAIRALHASNVSGEHISPASLVLTGGKASLDSAGTLIADSLIVGGTPVIDRTGTWVGQPISDQGGLGIQSISSVVVKDAEIFFFNSKWVSFDQFDTFIEFEESGKLDVSFAARITCSIPFNTRITIKQVSPQSQILGQFGNSAGAQASPTLEGATVHNQALIDLEAGTYRILIEHLSTSPIVGTLQSGSLIARLLY